jgi:hypothetical protein
VPGVLFKGCNWNFPRNLLIVCKAIGGNLHPGEPYAACARNGDLSPARPADAVAPNSRRRQATGVHFH